MPSQKQMGNRRYNDWRFDYQYYILYNYRYNQPNFCSMLWLLFLGSGRNFVPNFGVEMWSEWSEWTPCCATQWGFSNHCTKSGPFFDIDKKNWTQTLAEFARKSILRPLVFTETTRQRLSESSSIFIIKIDPVEVKSSALYWQNWPIWERITL